MFMWDATALCTRKATLSDVTRVGNESFGIQLVHVLERRREDDLENVVIRVVSKQRGRQCKRARMEGVDSRYTERLAVERDLGDTVERLKYDALVAHDGRRQRHLVDPRRLRDPLHVDLIESAVQILHAEEYSKGRGVRQ
jgi:hypothetical protein